MHKFALSLLLCYCLLMRDVDGPTLDELRRGADPRVLSDIGHPVTPSGELTHPNPDVVDAIRDALEGDGKPTKLGHQAIQVIRAMLTTQTSE